jgi:hypothetical protein
MVYRSLLDKLGVSISDSDSKSIISDNGALEFAKRYWVKNLQKDLSPVSVRAVHAATTTLSLCAFGHHYRLSGRVLMRFAGAGYRVRARPEAYQTRKWLKLLRAWTVPSVEDGLAFEFWLGRGLPLNPG